MKKLTFLLAMLCIPAVALAHGAEMFALGVSLYITPFLALIISPFLLRRLNKRTAINNKFLKIIYLIVIEIFFIFLLFISVGFIAIFFY